jgi:hypothetical protein
MGTDLLSILEDLAGNQIGRPFEVDQFGGSRLQLSADSDHGALCSQQAPER